MKRWLVFASLGMFMGWAAPRAHAKPNHTIEEVQKIVRGGKVVGARVHLLVDPQGENKFRINLGPQKQVPARGKTDDQAHRQTLAGMKGAFVQKLKEVRLKANDTSTTQEVYVDIMYDSKLKAGTKVNILTAYATDRFGGNTGTTSPHIWGAWDGPVTSGDKDFIITLPDNTSNVPNATAKVSKVAATAAAQ